MRRKVINFLYSHSLNFLLVIFHKFIGKNKIVINKSNTFTSYNSNIYRNNIFINGYNNQIEFKEDSLIEKSKIRIKGNNNKVNIGEKSYVCGLKLNIEGDNNTFYLGKNFFIYNDTYVSVIDGTKFVAGDNCMFANNIHIRTSDSHGILDMKTGKRINYEEDIVLGDKVWLGYGVTILKGAEIPNGCIVGAQSLVTKKFKNNNVIIAGNPAKEVKKDIEWTFDRIK